MRGLRVCRVLAAAALALSASGPAAAFAAGGAATTSQLPLPTGPAPANPAAAEGLEVALASVTPAVAAPGQSVVITGTVRNSGTAPVAKPLVRVVLGSAPLAVRRDVQRWAASTGPAQGTEVARQQLPADVGPGGEAPFRLEVPNATRLRSDRTYGALPLSVEVGATAVRTFAGFQRIKQYQPMRLAWAVPLSLDPDPALFGAEGAARESAWQDALGSGSRVARVIEATEAAPVTWAVDPTLVPSLVPEDLGGSAATSAPAGDSEGTLRAVVDERIRAAAGAHSPWVLPDTDADVSAAADGGQAGGLVASLVGRAQAAAQSLGGRADIVWPADGRHTQPRESALRRIYEGTGLGAQVAARSSLPDAPQSAVQRSADGLPLLVYDDQLSELVASLSSPSEGVLASQRLIADSVALLDERPGTSGRSVFGVAPRGFDPDTGAVAGFFATAAAVPWLEPTDTPTLLREAARAPQLSGATRPTPQPTAASTTDPYAGTAPVLTPARAAQLEGGLATVRGVALIRDDGDDFRRTWVRATEQLASVRWRTAPAAWSRLRAGVVTATEETTSAIKVSERNVNFLADTGRLQITVTNELDVDVENVKLTLAPENPRLRIDSQPPLLRIGANSRATTVVDVTTLAAGLVPIRTTLTTPDGTVIGQGANVRVRVTPTGDWVYWVLGAVAGIILVLGIWRSVRHKPERRPALPEELR